MRRKIIVNIILGILIILIIASGSYILYKDIEKNNIVKVSDCPNTEVTCTCNCDYDEALVENLGKNEFDNFYYYNGADITINDLSKNDKFAIVYNKIQPNESYHFPINPGDTISFFSQIDYEEIYRSIFESDAQIDYSEEFVISNEFMNLYCGIDTLRNESISCTTNETYENFGSGSSYNYDGDTYIVYDYSTIENGDLIVNADYLFADTSSLAGCGADMVCGDYETLTMNYSEEDIEAFALYSDPYKENKVDGIDYYFEVMGGIGERVSSEQITELINHYKEKNQTGKLQITYKLDSLNNYYWYSTEYISN